MKYLFYFLVILMLGACSNHVDTHKMTDADTNTISDDVKPDFMDTDSVEIYFYANPGNQKRFTRLFVTDQSSVKILVENMSRQGEFMKECPHDGKMFLYRKGEVFKTVYISTADSCRYLAYAINSDPRFVLINDPAYNLINELKSRAH